MSGAWETVLLGASLRSASHILRDPGIVLSPLCAFVSSFGLNFKAPPPLFETFGLRILFEKMMRAWAFSSKKYKKGEQGVWGGKYKKEVLVKIL